MSKSKLKQVFTYEDKKKFIQTLLIIAGVLTALNANPTNATIFVYFVIASVIYIIAISVIEKTDTKVLHKHERYTKITIAFASYSIGFCFSGIIFLVGFINSINQGVSVTIAIILWLVAYGILGGLLGFVLAK